MERNLKTKFYWILTISILGCAFLSLFVRFIYLLSDITISSNYSILKMLLYTLITGLVFFILTYTFYKKKPFTVSISYSLLFISILLLVYSILLPIYPQHLQFMPFRILAHGSTYLIDGWYFVGGLIVFLFSKLLKYGGFLQEEVDGII